MSRCAYGRALVAVLTGAGEVPAGYEFITSAHPSSLDAHDRFCRECSVADDSMNPDAAHLRKRSA